MRWSKGLKYFTDWFVMSHSTTLILHINLDGVAKFLVINLCHFLKIYTYSTRNQIFNLLIY